MYITGKRIRIGIGEGVVVKPPCIVMAEGLGSCVALVLYDIQSGIGGMAHIMLPGSSEYRHKKSGGGESELFAPYYCADTAISALLEELQNNGAQAQNIIAKMAGGARMFPTYNGTETGIGGQNIACIRWFLKKKLIPLVGEDIGGDYGRSVEFHAYNGKLVVTAVGKEPIEI